MSKVVVKSVNQDSAGQLAGLQQGDTIVGVYGVLVESRAQLIETMAAESRKNDSLSIEIERNGEPLTLSHPEPAESLGCFVKDDVSESPATRSNPQGGRLYILGVVGILTLVVGLYFLFLSHDETVNLHRLTIGQTLALIGALFIAMEWRPKSQTHTTE